MLRRDRCGASDGARRAGDPPHGLRGQHGVWDPGEHTDLGCRPGATTAEPGDVAFGGCGTAARRRCCAAVDGAQGQRAGAWLFGRAAGDDRSSRHAGQPRRDALYSGEGLGWGLRRSGAPGTYERRAAGHRRGPVAGRDPAGGGGIGGAGPGAARAGAEGGAGAAQRHPGLHGAGTGGALPDGALFARRS